MKRIRPVLIILILLISLAGPVFPSRLLTGLLTGYERVASHPTDSLLNDLTEETSRATLELSLTHSEDRTQPVSGEMAVHFLDVGQGAAVLFEINDQVMVFDGGGREASSFVVAYLKKQAIDQVDVMISSHYDADHLNGLVGILHTFPVRQVFDADYTTDTRVYQSFKTFIRDQAIPETVPRIGQSFPIGDATVTFIAPESYGNPDENDDSLAIRVEFGQTHFVIMGDSSADAELNMLDQDLAADVYFAAHHGSNGSNSTALLNKVAPDSVVISCGADNDYGHPGEHALSRIQATGAELYRTDKQGTIVATSDGETIRWDQAARNDFTPGTFRG